jgi:hypothetical protein
MSRHLRKSSNRDEVEERIKGCAVGTAIKRAQREMIRRLEDAGAVRLAKCLRKCSRAQCGQDICSSACRYGERRNYQKSRKRILSLLKHAPRPLLEVTVTRGCWAKQFGQLNSLNLRAAEQLARRALDKIRDPDVVAIGTIKAFVYPHHGGGWVCQVHLIVAGVERDTLEAAFRAKPYSGPFPQVVWASPIANLRRSLREIFRAEPWLWEHPRFMESLPSRANKAQRAEYYAWLASSGPDDQLIRYGCDRYYNKLKKQARRLPARKKRRRNLYWLQNWMFGPTRSGQERTVWDPPKAAVKPKIEAIPVNWDDGYFDDL